MSGAVLPFATGDEELLRANRPLELDDGRTAWLITAGRAQVFALHRPQDGTGVRRYPIVRVDAGQLVLPAGPDAPVGLLLVGLDPNTTAVAIDLAELEQVATSGGDAETIAGLVEAWLSALISAVDEVPPEDATPAVVGERLVVPAGTRIWPGVGTVWLDGAGLAFGVSERPVPAGVILPVPERFWVTAIEPVDMLVLDGTQALRRPEGWAGVRTLAGGALVRMRGQLEQEADRVIERVQRRVAHEDALVASAFTGLREVLGRQPVAAGRSADGDALLAAAQAVGASIGVHVVAPPGTSVQEPLKRIAQASGVRMREVALPARWWRMDVGPVVGTLAADGRPVALLPVRGGYDIVDPTEGTRARVTARRAEGIERQATMLYRPLPDRPLGLRDVLRYLRQPARGDLRRLSALALASGALALVAPLVTETIFGEVVPNLRGGELLWLSLLVALMMVAGFGIAVAQQLATLRIETRAAGELQAAVWDRLLDLPLAFFRKFPPGLLAERTNRVSEIHSLATAGVTAAALALPAGVFSLAIAFYLQPRMALFALVPILGICAVGAWLFRYEVARERERTDTLYGIGMEIVQSIGKLRVADAERRALVRWVDAFRSDKRRYFERQYGFALSTAAMATVPAVATLFVVAGAATLPHDSLSSATFLAFNAALLQAITAFSGLTVVAGFAAQTVALFEQAAPVFEAVPERTAVRTGSFTLRGDIDAAHVTLRYAPDEPLVLDDVSFTVAAGEFLAIVGPSGAGKSSLLRVLLGFEALDVGTIRYDGAPLESLDPSILRSQIGVVTQSARLMPGDIFSNIVGPRPLTVADAWEAARLAGFEEDIRAMPLGMRTPITDGATFSGGQRQRILIARAVAGRPRILLFDEATSALDNRTQAEIAAAIQALRGTRIVIAHRLSTVRRADRILVLDGGRIVQQGTFAELIAVDGLFRELAERQLG